VRQRRARQLEQRVEIGDGEKTRCRVQGGEIIDDVDDAHPRVIPGIKRLELQGHLLAGLQVIGVGSLAADDQARTFPGQLVEQDRQRFGGIVRPEASHGGQRGPVDADHRAGDGLGPSHQPCGIAPDARHRRHAIEREQVFDGRQMIAGEGEGRLAGVTVLVAFGFDVHCRFNDQVGTDAVVYGIGQAAVERAGHRGGEPGQAEREGHQQQHAPVARLRASQLAQRHQQRHAAPHTDQPGGCAQHQRPQAQEQQHQPQRKQGRTGERQRIAERCVGLSDQATALLERIQHIARRD